MNNTKMSKGSSTSKIVPPYFEGAKSDGSLHTRGINMANSWQIKGLKHCLTTSIVQLLLTLEPHTEIKPKQSIVLHTFPKLYRSWRKVLFVGIGTPNKYGDRSPGIIIGDDNKIYTSSAVNGNWNLWKVYGDPLTVGEYTKITVRQYEESRVYKFDIVLNDTLMFETVNNDAREFTNAMVHWPSGNLAVADATIKDLQIITPYDGQNIFYYNRMNQIIMLWRIHLKNPLFT